jgi:hypothetical protein
MIKEIALALPRYVVKYILSEPDYTLADMPTRSGISIILVPKVSEIGRLIHCVSRTIPYTQSVVERPLLKSHQVVRFRYNCKKKSFDVPVEKYTELEAVLVEQFRASLVKEVSAIHYEHPEDSYSWMVRSFLTRRGIVIDDASDKDIEWDTAKKIYRDHLSRIQEKNHRKSLVSIPVMSCI